MLKNNLWVFSIQDNICGGIIIADSESEARSKLSKQRGLHMEDDATLIYKLSDDLFDKFDIYDLW